MGKLIKWAKKYWNESVRSNVIAGIVLAFLGAVGAGLYALAKRIFAHISFSETFSAIWDFLLLDVSLPVWLIICCSIVLLVFSVKSIVSIFRAKEETDEQLATEEVEKFPPAYEPSTVMFSYRVASAFPGVRKVTWFNNPTDAVNRLEILLKAPLRFSDGRVDCETDPIWWFRGNSAMHIQNFARLSRTKILLDHWQFKIKRIAVCHSGAYYKDFIYVETFGEEQTGLYKLTNEDIKEQVEYFGYSWEEYAIIKYFLFWKKFISRQDYDDGATTIRGKVIETEGAELRVRYLSNYNFIIAAKGSPYNSIEHNQEFEDYFQGLLKGEKDHNDFFTFLDSFKKKNNSRWDQ